MNLQERIEQILASTPPNILRLAREELSSSYREKNSSHSIFSDRAKRLAYLATRFPATFAAVQEVCKQPPATHYWIWEQDLLRQHWLCLICIPISRQFLLNKI